MVMRGFFLVWTTSVDVGCEESFMNPLIPFDVVAVVILGIGLLIPFSVDMFCFRTTCFTDSVSNSISRCPGSAYGKLLR